MTDTTTAGLWLCRWDDVELLVNAATIEDARLEARRHAGPHSSVSARLATRGEMNDPELNRKETT